VASSHTSSEAKVYSQPQSALLNIGFCAATIALLHLSSPGYLTKQESIAVLGVDDLLIRSLLDKNQFHDPLDEALNLGISSATWPLFGLLWPSGQRMAERMAQRPVTSERILEIGCGLGLSSLVAHRRGANVTASDCHPLTHAFLDENTRLNGLPPMAYRHGLWGTAALREDGLPVLTSAQDDGVSGLFDLIVGSDILYERDDEGTLASFINAHAGVSEIWVVTRTGATGHFHKYMARVGFAMRAGGPTRMKMHWLTRAHADIHGAEQDCRNRIKWRGLSCIHSGWQLKNLRQPPLERRPFGIWLRCGHLPRATDRCGTRFTAEGHLQQPPKQCARCLAWCLRLRHARTTDREV
jgi:predicted nicotinamide N-methyase